MKISLKRNDFFTNSQGNAYNSPDNLMEMRKLNIRQTELNKFTERLSKCTNPYPLQTFIRIIILAITIPVLGHYLYENTFLKQDIELRDLMLRPFILFIEIWLLIWFLYNYFIIYKIMRIRAQHIIDLENINNNFFQFNLNKLTLALEIEAVGKPVLDEALYKQQNLLRDIYCIPNVFNSSSLIDIKSYSYDNNYAIYDLCIKIIEEGITIYQENLFYLVCIVLVPLGILLASLKVLDLMITRDRKIFMGLLFVMVTVMIFFVSRFYSFMSKKVGEFSLANNFRFESKGIYVNPHIMGKVCYIFIFDPRVKIVDSYTVDLRTKKYFE
jgi:hypothetical protein